MLFNKINNWLADHKVIAGLLLFLLCLGFFGWLESAPTFSDPDSFYHTKIAVLISEQGIIHDFPYLQFTTLKDGFIDHHLLYHLYLVPFIKIFPPLVGAKIGHSLLVALALLSLYWLLIKFRVRGAIWYVIFLLFVEPFVFRLGLIKAQPLSLIILFLGVYFITARKYYLLTLLSFIYVWSYGGWFLIFIVTALYVGVESLDVALVKLQHNQLSRILNFKIHTKNWWLKFYIFIIEFLRNMWCLKNLKLLTSVVLGLILGLIINPYFPKNLEFYYIHIIKIAFINYQSVIGVGSEWYPYSVNDFFINNLLPFGLSFVALAIFLNYHRQFDVIVKYALALFLVFVLTTIKSRRNIEYLGPFAVIFAATTFSRALAIVALKNDIWEFKRIIKKIFITDIYTKALCLTFFSTLILLSFYRFPYHAKKSLDHGFRFEYLKSASNYLSNNSQPGDIVLHSDWDEFPILFYHNSKNYYIVGLDPTFMYLYDHDLYQKWVAITRGQESDYLYNNVKAAFRAKYILATTDHVDMIKNLENNIYLDKVYIDSEAVIYRVL